MKKVYLITGAAGFIGSAFLRLLLEKYSDISIVVADLLTYAGNLGTIKNEIQDPRVTFCKVDIASKEDVTALFKQHAPSFVVNFAAESHVDRSIEDPAPFVRTNIMGTQLLLEAARCSWKSESGYRDGVRFLQISTDEVYGTLTRDFEEPIPYDKLPFNKKIAAVKFGNGLFSETTPLAPVSPYSASKASADLLVMAYGKTYGLPINITRCSNNYGPYQFPEKLIPLAISNLLNGKKIPIYGSGKNVRDWLYVEDHCRAIDLVLHHAEAGTIYNIGGFNEEENISLIEKLISAFNKEKNLNLNFKNEVIFVKDRLGHDMRYAIDSTKIARDLGWYPKTDFRTGLEKTVNWYLKNGSWLEEINSGAYLKYRENI